MGGQPKDAERGGLVHVLADAGAGVVIPDADDAQLFGRAFGQSFQIEENLGLVLWRPETGLS